MAPITLENVTKVFPNGYTALDGLSIRVDEGEFMVVVGPSGCGKTTALRMVAGLEDITSGLVRIGDRVVNDLSPKHRDVAMVFQNYALYPHMTVAQNIGFALKLRKMPKSEIKARVDAAATVLGLTDWLDKRPAQLSGGMRQRVAMGRVIVREPQIFLMDEPLSNLDAKLRVQMRAEIMRIQRRLGVATLYVTHDQTEAMTMGDRVAVMSAGVLQQCAPPQVCYDEPANLFVAAFLGSPTMNLFEAGVSIDGHNLSLGDQTISLGDAAATQHPGLNAFANKQVIVGIRPEHLTLVSDGGSDSVISGTVSLVEALGSELLVYFTIGAKRILAHEAEEEHEEALEAGELNVQGEAVARANPRDNVKLGERIHFSVEPERFHFFDPDNGSVITK